MADPADASARAPLLQDLASLGRPTARLTRRMLETTWLPPHEEARFQAWARQNKITDVDHPDSFYDYRGYWKAFGDRPIRYGLDHFTDTFKQHGHPTFSIESQYARPGEGGVWLTDEDLLAQPSMAVSHMTALTDLARLRKKTR